MDETSYDELPSPPMRALVMVFGSVPGTMTNGAVETAIEGLEGMLRANLDLPEVVRRDVQHVLHALALDRVFYSGVIE